MKCSFTRLSYLLFLVVLLVAAPSFSNGESDDNEGPGGEEDHHHPGMGDSSPPCQPGSNCQPPGSSNPPPPPTKGSGSSAPERPPLSVAWRVKTTWSMQADPSQFDSSRQSSFIAAMSLLTGVQAQDIVVNVVQPRSARRLLQSSTQTTTLDCAVHVGDEQTALDLSKKISAENLAPLLVKEGLPTASMIDLTVFAPQSSASGSVPQPFNGPAGNKRPHVSVDEVKNAGIAFGLLYTLCLLCAGLPTSYIPRDSKPKLGMVALVALWTLIVARALFFFVDPFHARGTFCLSLMFTLYGLYFPLAVLLKFAHCSIHGYMNRAVTVISLLLIFAELVLQVASDIWKGEHLQNSFERAPLYAFIVLGTMYSVAALTVSAKEKNVFLFLSSLATLVVVIFNLLEEAKVYHLLDELSLFVIYCLLELLVVFFDGLALRQWLNSRNSFPVGVVEGSVDGTVKKQDMANFVYPSAPEIRIVKHDVAPFAAKPVKGICESSWEPFSNEMPDEFKNKLQVVVETASVSSGGTSRPSTAFQGYPRSPVVSDRN